MKATPAPAAAKGATFKKTGNINAGFGHVTSIRQGDEYPMDRSAEDDGMAEISIRHGPKPKPRPPGSLKKNDYAEPYKPTKTSRVHISADEARALKIGQRVKVSLTPA